ncbi:MAG: hypothetical protein Q7R85_01115 [bacterium]|nr:hypothetical protein [bacterium]
MKKRKKGLSRPRRRAKKGIGIGTHDEVRCVREHPDGQSQYRCRACPAVGTKGELRKIPCPHPRKVRPCDIGDVAERN